MADPGKKEVDIYEMPRCRPEQCHGLCCAQILEEEPELVTQLQDNAHFMHDGIGDISGLEVWAHGQARSSMFLPRLLHAAAQVHNPTRREPRGDIACRLFAGQERTRLSHPARPRAQQAAAVQVSHHTTFEK
jgi:hypothetical protein